MIIRELLIKATQRLQQVSDSARLDSEVLLAYVLQVSRSYLYTWPDKEITDAQQKEFLVLVAKREQHYPVAYLIGEREFYDHIFLVTEDTLVPRPDTELIVDLALERFTAQAEIKVADLGTGSGVIALAIAAARPDWQVVATDNYQATLAVAKQNVKRLGLTNVEFYLGDWCQALPKLKFDMIVSNPPYIAEDDTHFQQGELRHEPQHALRSGADGLAAIKTIIAEARDYLQPGGWLLLEHGYQQGKMVRDLLVQANYNACESFCDLAGHERVTIAASI